MNFDNFKYGKDQIPANYIKRKQFFEDLKQTFLTELKQNKTHRFFFKKYDPDTVDYFLLSYAEAKTRLAEHYEYTTDEERNSKELKYRSQTEEMLDMIRHKQLFNIQLQWRAGQLDIKEIEISIDFNFWESHIRSCPFLPLISRQEIDVMKHFLRSNNFADWHENVWGWQNFEEIMKKNEQGDREFMPEWYEYYDGHMGTGALLLLPDLRGDKEEYYMEIGRKYLAQKRKEELEKNPPPPFVPPPKHLFAGYKEMYEYALRYEPDPYFKELFRLQCALHDKEEKDEYQIPDETVEDAVYTLQEADVPVYMPGGMEWREAIVLCARQYVNGIVASELDTVYEEYLMYHDMGITSGKSYDELMKDFRADYINNLFKENFLMGRKLSGEAEDFNF
ncbi:MAG: hypothetical protein V2A54_11445 [Bacteroidota bacterium]